MSHFVRVNPTGWGSGEELLSSQTNQIDTNLAKAINGDDGGTWGPADPIVLQGDGMSFDCPVMFTGSSVTTIASGATITMTAATWTAETTSIIKLVDTAKIRLEETAFVEFAGTSYMTLASGTSIQLSGSSQITMVGTSSLALSGTATATLATGTSLTAAAGSTVALNGTTTIASGGTITGATGSTLTSNGATVLGGTVTLNSANPIALSTARSYERVCKPLTTATSSTWAASSNPEIFPFEISQIDTTTEKFGYLADVPDGATITSIMVSINPANGHGTVPDSPPKIYLYKFNVKTRTKTLVTTYDDNQSVPDYNNARLIQTATVSATRDASSDVFVVQLEGESGTNSINGLTFSAPIAVFTRAEVGEE